MRSNWKITICANIIKFKLLLDNKLRTYQFFFMQRIIDKLLIIGHIGHPISL